jgi:uncharacterized membrane protein YciS (DUF1049 family)
VNVVSQTATKELRCKKPRVEYTLSQQQLQAAVATITTRGYTLNIMICHHHFQRSTLRGTQVKRQIKRRIGDWKTWKHHEVNIDSTRMSRLFLRFARTKITVYSS